MIKGVRRAKLINAGRYILESVYEWYKLYDKIHNTSLSKQFYCAYLDEQKYSLSDISSKFGDSESTVRRNIRKFNEVINIVKSQMLQNQK